MPTGKPHIPDFKRVVAPAIRAGFRAARESIRTFVEDERDKFVERVKAQQFPSFKAKPLSPTYLAWKKSHGLDPRTMIRTSRYIDKVTTHETGHGGTGGLSIPANVEFRIGFDHDDRATDIHGRLIHLRLNVLARIHEFGSALAGIPARPHWRPFYKVIRVDAPAAAKAAGAAFAAASNARLATGKGGKP